MSWVLSGNLLPKLSFPDLYSAVPWVCEPEHRGTGRACTERRGDTEMERQVRKTERQRLTQLGPGVKGAQRPPRPRCCSDPRPPQLERHTLGGPSDMTPTQFPGCKLWFGVFQSSSPVPSQPRPCVRLQGTPDEGGSSPVQEGPKEARGSGVPGPGSGCRFRPGRAALHPSDLGQVTSLLGSVTLPSHPLGQPQAIMRLKHDNRWGSLGKPPARKGRGVIKVNQNIGGGHMGAG